MKSIYACTGEIDDIQQAVADLKAQIDSQGPLLANSCGIVNVDYETDVEALAKELNEVFDFPVFGCTAISVLNKNDGHTDLCVSMMVLTADDCEFHVGMTEEMHHKKDVSLAELCYRELRTNFKETEKLIFLYTPLWDELVPDDVAERLNKACEGRVPIFGGISSDDWKFNKYAVFCNGEASRCKAVIMLITGNVKPITKVEHSVDTLTDFNCVVTESTGTKVTRLNDSDSIGVLKKAGLSSDKDVVITDFMGTPFLSVQYTDDDDEIEILRGLYKIDHDERALVFLGNVAAGSRLSMAIVNRKNVEESVEKAMGELLEDIESAEEESDYRYSTIIITSCAARYNFIIGDKQMEARSYLGKLRNDINVFGYYSYGEFCPVRGKLYGNPHNVTHHETFAIMAL